MPQAVLDEYAVVLLFGIGKKRGEGQYFHCVAKEPHSSFYSNDAAALT
jgi:hypothetical protein